VLPMSKGEPRTKKTQSAQFLNILQLGNPY